jgi:hypothetical protein
VNFPEPKPRIHLACRSGFGQAQYSMGKNLAPHLGQRFELLRHKSPSAGTDSTASATGACERRRNARPSWVPRRHDSRTRAQERLREENPGSRRQTLRCSVDTTVVTGPSRAYLLVSLGRRRYWRRGQQTAGLRQRPFREVNFLTESITSLIQLPILQRGIEEIEKVGSACYDGRADRGKLLTHLCRLALPCS